MNALCILTLLLGVVALLGALALAAWYVVAGIREEQERANVGIQARLTEMQLQRLTRQVMDQMVDETRQVQVEQPREP